MSFLVSTLLKLLGQAGAPSALLWILGKLFG